MTQPFEFDIEKLQMMVQSAYANLRMTKRVMFEADTEYVNFETAYKSARAKAESTGAFEAKNAPASKALADARFAAEIEVLDILWTECNLRRYEFDLATINLEEARATLRVAEIAEGQADRRHAA